MNKSDNTYFAEILEKIQREIENDQFGEAVALVQDFVTHHSEMIDDRARMEISMIENMMKYKSAMKEWSYFYSMKLVYQYCESRYANDEVCASKISDKERLPDADMIWWCWLQGLENAPDIVKVCYHSLQKLGRSIRIVTADNYSEYADIPDELVRKWKNGKISNTHFSDLLRIELLNTRGGIWIDATVLCTDTHQINDIITNTDLFVYSFVMRDSISSFMMYDNWFLRNAYPSSILEDTRSMLYAYWRNEDTLMHYFIFQLLFSIACRRHPEECKRIPVWSAEPCHILQLEMMEQFDENRYKQILSMSGIHKLTWKYDTSAEYKETYLDHITKQFV